MSAWTPRLRALTNADLPAVVKIERILFGADAWPLSFFRQDLANHYAHYFLLELQGQQGDAAVRMAGYAAYWLLDDEANLQNIAVAPVWQGQSWGRWLLLHSLIEMQARGAASCTLEVRVGNLRAQALYHKLGFLVEGRRRGYYLDNGEDALVMTTPRWRAPLRETYPD